MSLPDQNDLVDGLDTYNLLNILTVIITSFKF